MNSAKEADYCGSQRRGENAGKTGVLRLEGASLDGIAQMTTTTSVIALVIPRSPDRGIRLTAGLQCARETCCRAIDPVRRPGRNGDYRNYPRL